MSHIYWRLHNLAGTYGCINEWVPYDGTGTQIATTGGTASADDSTHGAAANAFDGNASTFWEPTNTFPHWLEYQFPSAVEIASFTLISNDGGVGKGIIDLDLQYSDDGSTWFTKYSYRGVSWKTIGPITFNSSNALPSLGIAWRVLINSTYATGGQIDITDIVLRDGSGSAIATSQYAATAYSTYAGDTTHGACAAFDGDATTYWSANGITVPGWIAYRFGSLVQVGSFCVTPNSPQGPNSVTLQYSYDETNWTSAGTFSLANSSAQQCFSLGATYPAAATITTSPSSGTQGGTYTVTITGTGTHFASGSTTVSFSGAGGTVSSVSVASATGLTFTLALSATATTGAQTITVATGAEAPAATFTVTASARGNTDYDQIGMDARHGSTGTKIQYSDNTGATNHLAAFDANGNLTDSAISIAGVGSGSVTSVSVPTIPSWLSASVANPTTTPAISISAVSEAANLVLASPNGSSGAMTPRALVAADLPIATISAFGAVKPDGTTITISAGVISSSGGGGGSVPTGISSGVDWPPSSPTAYDDEFTDASLNARWSWVNQGSATATLTKSRLLLNPVTGAQNERMIVQATPATPWEFTAKFNVSGNYSQTAWGGITAYDSISGRCEPLHYYLLSSAAGVTIMHLNSVSSFNSQPFTKNNAMFGFEDSYYKIKDDGTNLIFSWSIDGVNWQQLYSEARTSWLTNGADHIGLTVDSWTSPTPYPILSCDWFRRTA